MVAEEYRSVTTPNEGDLAEIVASVQEARRQADIVIFSGHSHEGGRTNNYPADFIETVAHAVIDALLGAAAAGDVGTHFPPGKEEWEGADSMDLLERSKAILDGMGYIIRNVDITVICEEPRIAPWAWSIRQRLAGVLEIGEEDVSLKGKTNEGMGWIGTGEGLAVHAVALIERANPRRG